MVHNILTNKKCNCLDLISLLLFNIFSLANIGGCELNEKQGCSQCSVTDRLINEEHLAKRK